MAIEHSVIPEAHLHEPKGVSTAAAGTVYMADGAGSGAWEHHAASVHGEIYLASASVSVGPTGGTITSDADYRNIGPTWSVNPDAYFVELNTDNKAIKVKKKGHYLLSAFASIITGATADGTEYAMKFRINDSATLSSRRLVATKYGTAVRRFTLAGTALVMLNAEDYLDLMLASSAIDTITATDAGITLVLLHEVD